MSKLARPLAISLPAVLQHLAVFENAGLIRSEKIGRVRTCRMTNGALERAERWIADYRIEMAEDASSAAEWAD